MLGRCRARSTLDGLGGMGGGGRLWEMYILLRFVQAVFGIKAGDLIWWVAHEPYRWTDAAGALKVIIASLQHKIHDHA